MDRFWCSIVLCAVFVVLSHLSSAQNVHVVGDGMGWTVPPNPSSYASWASGRTFVLGDILQFNFMTNNHDVVRVPEASYNACSDDNEIGETITIGPANMTLDSIGSHYYICTIGSHCQAGQRLAVTVGGPTTNIPPRTAPPFAASPGAACEPTPSNAGGPGAAMTPPSMQNSASTSLAAAFVLSALSIGIAFI